MTSLPACKVLDTSPFRLIVFACVAVLPPPALCAESSPAQLPVVGLLEMEVGGLRVRADGARRDSLPVQLRLAFSPEWGLLLGGEVHVVNYDDARDGAPSASGAGDTTVVLKRTWAIDDATGLGLELGVKLATAKDSIGSGKTDTALNAIYSKDLGAVHMDVNLNFTRFGVVDVDTGRIQTGLSASFSTPLNAQWSVTAELSGTRRSGADRTRQLLGALSYSPSKQLTFDIGMARAAKPSPGATSLFANVVFPVAVLW